MEKILGQAVMFGIAGRLIVRPTTIESVGCRNPKRAVTIFDQVVDKALLRIIARYPYINRQEREPPATRVQPIETFVCPAPDAAVPSFE